MTKCGSFGNCIYNTTAGCISPFNCPHKIENESITTATSTPLNPNVIYTTETDKDAEIARLTAENVKLTRKTRELEQELAGSIKIPFKVIDKSTGKQADEGYISKNEEWAHHLVYCDMDGFAVTQDGNIILLDETGKFAYCPFERFEIVKEEDEQ